MDDVGGPSRATRVSLSGKMGEGNVFLFFFFSSLEVGKVFLMLRSRGAKKKFKVRLGRINSGCANANKHT